MLDKRFLNSVKDSDRNHFCNSQGERLYKSYLKISVKPRVNILKTNRSDWKRDCNASNIFNVSCPIKMSPKFSVYNGRQDSAK